MNNTKFYYLYNILVTVALSFFNPILYIYLLSKDFSFAEVGLYLSIFWLTSFMTELPCGAITDNIGAKNSSLLSSVFRVIGLILLLSNSLILLYISAILSAIATSFQSGTLTSWLVNVNNKNNEEIDIDKVLSRSSLYALFFSAIIGFISAKYVYVYYKSLSIILSMTVFVISLFITFLFMKNLEITQKISIEKLKGSFGTVKNSLKETLYVKSSVFLMILFVIPSILDLGPSNQWQAVFEKLDANIIGYIWVGISISGMLGSLIYEKLSNELSKLHVLYLFVVINIGTLLMFIFIQNVYAKFLLFMLYIIFFTMMSIQVNVFMHKYLVKSDENRTTTVSIFYTFESIIVAILLSVNGLLTDRVGIENTWLVFMALAGVIILSFMLVKLKKRRIK
ncbi:MFS transporter [Gemella haemolysans]|uniref:MFS transporter n=1 Tax=Gemella haemolysans TaxID=1379 RepID=UPI0019569988|nr:MFS transporter [Gemella haemolysans]VTX79404.1 Major Facilitator Superfamily protein [Gemella haemolysans]